MTTDWIIVAAIAVGVLVSGLATVVTVARVQISRLLIRLARRLNPSGSRLDALRDHYDNTDFSDEIRQAHWVPGQMVININGAAPADGRDIARQLAANIAANRTPR